MDQILKNLFYIVLIVVIGGLLYTSVVINNQEERIQEKIESIDGEVVEIDYKVFNKGPFWYASKGAHVYKITYIQDCKEKIGWAKFGFTAKYKLDYKE